MNEQKIIEYLVKKATLVKTESIEIEEKDFVDLPLKEFSEMKGDLYFNQEDSSFYKFLGGKWFRYKNKKKEEPNKEIPSNFQIKLNDIYGWSKKFSDFINYELDTIKSRLGKLEQDQQEFFRQIKENIDLQIRVATHREEKKEDGSKPKRVQKDKGS